MNEDKNKSISLPPPFQSQMNQLLGHQEANELFTALETIPPTSIRYNLHKKQLALPLSSAIPWCPWAQYLPQRPKFTLDPELHAGAYYVQEASSMILALIAPLLPQEPITALDLCAAPGGKSTLLTDILPSGSLLISNELFTERAHILRENVQKWGNPNSIVTSTSAQSWGGFNDTFDLILVDAPCSGEGMFRKDHEARNLWHPRVVEQSAQTQREILSNVWPALRQGGLLVYSTCTFNQQENEDILSYIVDELGGEPLSLDLPEGAGIRTGLIGLHPAYRMMPHRVAGEGLFLCALRKPGTHTEKPKKETKGKKKSKTKEADFVRQVRGWIRTSDYPIDEWLLLPSQDIYALPPAVQPWCALLRERNIPILSAGVHIGQMKGKSILPAAGLSLSWAFESSAFATYDASLEEAQRYIAREAISLPQTLPIGYIVIRYNGLPLGFMKHIGNRANNLYPEAWRIRNLENLLKH